MSEISGGAGMGRDSRYGYKGGVVDMDRSMCALLCSHTVQAWVTLTLT